MCAILYITSPKKHTSLVTCYVCCLFVAVCPPRHCFHNLFTSKLPWSHKAMQLHGFLRRLQVSHLGHGPDGSGWWTPWNNQRGGLGSFLTCFLWRWNPNSSTFSSYVDSTLGFPSPWKKAWRAARARHPLYGARLSREKSTWRKSFAGALKSDAKKCWSSDDDDDDVCIYVMLSRVTSRHC